jgi:hypothetical protein
MQNMAILKPSHKYQILTIDYVFSLVILACTVFLFRLDIFDQYIWIGNSDRINNELKILQFYLTGDGFNFPSWNDSEMLGFDSSGMVGTSPNPLIYIIKVAHPFFSNLYALMGYVNILLLFLTGISAYYFLRSIFSANIPTLVGALCYEFSSLTILKFSQNSMSFAVFLMIPLLLRFVSRIQQTNLISPFVVITLLLIGTIEFMFLQKVSYLMILIGAFSVWVSLEKKTYWPILITFIASIVAIIFCLPRFGNIYISMQEYSRVIEGINLKSFTDVYNFQNIKPYEILRWFNAGIFGSSPSDARYGNNNINLTEGFILYTSGFTPLLIIYCLFFHKSGWLDVYKRPLRAEPFFLLVLIFCIGVVTIRPVGHLIFLLFLKTDFTHSRILIIALIALCALLVSGLNIIKPNDSSQRNIKLKILGLIFGIITIPTLEYISSTISHNLHLSWINLYQNTINLKTQSCIEILLISLIFLIILIFLKRKNSSVAIVAYFALCGAIPTQAILHANQTINGEQALNSPSPFSDGNFYHAKRSEFILPTYGQLKTIEDKINTDKYRVVTVCEPPFESIMCSGHTSIFWGLRSADGYYGIGVPKRIRLLPWPKEVISLRSINFSDKSKLPWEILALINVKYAVIANNSFYKNTKNDLGSNDNLSHLNIITSPINVIPRAFFANSIEPVDDAKAAALKLFNAKTAASNPVNISFVEQIEHGAAFNSNDTPDVRGRNDKLIINFPKANVERFLVLNELYYPGWEAHSHGAKLKIYPANVVMRGVFVPPNSSEVIFKFKPVSTSRISLILRALATFIFMVTIFRLIRQKKLE